ncbi:hypothetical protein [Lysinibacillus agricola]
MMHECQRPLTHHQTRRTPLCILNGRIKINQVTENTPVVGMDSVK